MASEPDDGGSSGDSDANAQYDELVDASESEEELETEASTQKLAENVDKTKTNKNKKNKKSQTAEYEAQPETTSESIASVEEHKYSVEELRERLAQKIKTLREQRKAPGSGMPGAPLNRDEILRVRKEKAEHKKQQLHLQRKKKADEEKLKEEAETKALAAATIPARDVETETGTDTSAVFTRITLATGEEVSSGGEIIAKKRKRGPSDLLGQLKHVEAKKARIERMDADKRGVVEEKERWKRAIKQAGGEKIRDDEAMLKKSLTKQRKRKEKSAKEWKDRKEGVEKGIKLRLKKREENIAARIDQIKKNRQKRASKKKKRAGFEGKRK
ncbi:surfeit locus protein 6-domain-containing protein [Limtongia smithiae]|uniref:surfeit locus protein 6-domain-containing protein n=1 Tax=Limtongia smithiae TaxID=1125753 RepID=UPI0034CEF6F8